MSLNYSFAGKNVLITGGTRGIGRQLVKRFYEGGANVFTFGRTQANVDKLIADFPKVTAKAVDMKDWDGCRKVIQSFGPMDHLVNNAAILIPQTFMEITEKDALNQYHTDVVGAINVTQVVAKGMIERGGGTIVNISAVDIHKIAKCIAGPAATKAAMKNFSKAMAVELGAHNIRVNAVCLGIVHTAPPNMPNHEFPPDELEKYLERLVFKREVDIDEVANLVLYLLSPLSTMIVGEAIAIDGGWKII